MTPPEINPGDFIGLYEDHHKDNQRRFKELEDALIVNTELTKKQASDTADLLDLFNSVKGGFKVLGWIGGFAKWVAALVACFAAIYAFVQNVRGRL